MSLARGDLSPHIIIQSPRLRGGEFESTSKKDFYNNIGQQQTSAQLHSITSSAKADSDGGMVSCSNLAVCILIRKDK